MKTTARPSGETAGAQSRTSTTHLKDTCRGLSVCVAPRSDKSTRSDNRRDRKRFHDSAPREAHAVAETTAQVPRGPNSLDPASLPGGFLFCGVWGRYRQLVAYLSFAFHLNGELLQESNAGAATAGAYWLAQKPNGRNRSATMHPYAAPSWPVQPDVAIGACNGPPSSEAFIISEFSMTYFLFIAVNTAK